MTLRDEFEKSGNWLFRWRSYLPLIMLGLLLISIRDFKYIGNSHSLDMFWEVACLLVALFGLGIRIYTIGHVPKGTSGRQPGSGSGEPCAGDAAEVLSVTRLV